MKQKRIIISFENNMTRSDERSDQWLYQLGPSYHSYVHKKQLCDSKKCSTHVVENVLLFWPSTTSVALQRLFRIGTQTT